MAPDKQINSILAVDCGSVTSTALLIEPMEGEYRLAASGQAPSTYGLPWQDITIGVVAAARQIEKVTGRALLATGGGWPITPQSSAKQGVDAFIVVSSAGEPLQVVLAGLMPEITLASALRAAATTYTAISQTLSLDSEPGPAANGSQQGDRAGPEARIQAFQESAHEAILLVGGTDGGATRPVIDIANILSMAMRVLTGAERPTILYAGNSAIREEIAGILGTAGPFKAIDNIRPTLESENLAATQVELEQLYIQRKMFRLPGFEKLSKWSQHPVVPASKSFEKLIAYIGRHNGLNVIGVDLGSRSTVISSHVQGQHSSIIRSDAGMGHSLTALLKSVPLQKFQRWLPFVMEPDALYHHLLNKSLHPAAIPTTYQELLIDHAVAREAIRLVMEQAQAGWTLQRPSGGGSVPWNLIIGAGRTLTRAPRPGDAALVLLDSLEPWGVSSLALDISGAGNVLGSIAAVQPVAAVEVAIHDTFLNLGTVIAPLGHGVPGKTALKLKIDYQSGLPETEVEAPGEASASVELDVPYGSIEMVALPPGQRARLEMRPTRHFDIGLGQPGRGAVTEIEGGILGVIIDARGRPLRLPQDEAVRHDRLAGWFTALDIPTLEDKDNVATATQIDQQQ